METCKHIWQFLSFYLLTAVSILRWLLQLPNFSGFFVKFSDMHLSLRYMLCNMRPCTIDLDEKTTMHFWVTNHRQFNKPNLVLIHGYGGNSRWQFLPQLHEFSYAFNLYIPDLLFFGKSHTKGADRSVLFQAKCVGEGVRKLGVDRYSVVGLSYGGYVAYGLADMCAEAVEKVVIVSTGICYTEEQKATHLKKYGNIKDLLLPQKPEDARGMIRLAMFKLDPLKWVPDFVLWQFIHVS